MFDIFSNPLIILLAATLIVTALMFLFVGRKKKKNKKVEKVYDKETGEKKAEKIEKVEEIQKSDNEEKAQKTDDFDEKRSDLFEKVEENDENASKKEKKITKVYVRKIKETNAKSVDESQVVDKYQQLSDRAEFVKTSKTVSKFGSFKTDEQLAAEAAANEASAEVKQEDCVICEEIKTRIDHSKRLSKIIKDGDFDNLFVSHITEHYLNVDPGRHLSSKIENDIFKRANELVENGTSRALDSESQIEYNKIKGDKEKLRFWFEQTVPVSSENIEEPEDDFQLEANNFSLKNMLLAEALLKRKKMKK